MIDQILITDMTDDEWTESAENEPDELWGCGGCGNRWPLSQLRERGCPDCYADRGGDIECADKFEQRDSSPLVKPLGVCVTLVRDDGMHWDV